jgi:tetratricopeptide (TPR) repeat protein
VNEQGKQIFHDGDRACNVSAMRWTIGLVLASLVATAGARSSVAQPAPDPAAARRDEAKAAFGRGKAAYNLGKYADAIAEFEKAYSLSRLPEILFNLGQCYRKQWESERRTELGRRALHYYEALLREAPVGSPFRQDAEQFIAELGPAVAAAEAQERQGKIAAAKGAEALQLAQSFHGAGQLADAAGVLDRLLREPGNGRDLLAEGYLLRGRVAAGQGDPLAAEALFRRALELAPQAELAQPRGQEAAAFEAARKTYTAGGLRLVQAPLGEAQAGVAARIDVKVEGDSEKMVAALELGYRNADTGAFLTARAKPPVTLTVPGVSLTPGARIDYYVRALDEHGGVLAESGTPTLPFRLQVAAPEEIAARQAALKPTPWYGKWWLWTIAGAVVLGAGGTAYVVTRPESDFVVPGPTVK